MRQWSAAEGGGWSGSTAAGPGGDAAAVVRICAGGPLPLTVTWCERVRGASTAGCDQLVLHRSPPATQRE